MVCSHVLPPLGLQLSIFQGEMHYCAYVWYPKPKCHFLSSRSHYQKHTVFLIISLLGDGLFWIIFAALGVVLPPCRDVAKQVMLGVSRKKLILQCDAPVNKNHLNITIWNEKGRTSRGSWKHAVHESYEWFLSVCNSTHNGEDILVLLCTEIIS